MEDKIVITDEIQRALLEELESCEKPLPIFPKFNFIELTDEEGFTYANISKEPRICGYNHTEYYKEGI